MPVLASLMFALLLQAVPAPQAPAQPGPPPDDVQELVNSIKQVVGIYSLVEQNAAEPVDPATALYQGAIPGMLRTLDPHSIFFDRDHFQQLQEMQNSVQRGFGSIVSVLPGRVMVLQTMPGSPAEKSGLAPGDEILAVNGYALQALNFDQLVALLTQSRQQRARLILRRSGSDGLMDITLTPAELQTPSVERAFPLEDGFGYIRLTSFDVDTGEQLHKAIEKLGGAGLKGLVLDMRDNPGGVLQAAIDAAGLFLEPHALLLTARGRIEESRPVYVDDSAHPYKFPMTVIVDHRTASAAEILAGALQDHNRAKVIGQQSFGKGLVQQVYPLSDDTGLALTTAFYYTPSGRSIQRPLRDVQLDVNYIEQHAPLKQASSTGGIKPDIMALPENPGRLGTFLETSGLLTVFVVDYLKKAGPVTDAFAVTPKMLDDFQFFLSERNVRPNLSEWSASRAWLESRLKQEVLNLSLGVAKGDEVDMLRDPAVRRSIEVLRNS